MQKQNRLLRNLFFFLSMTLIAACSPPVQPVSGLVTEAAIQTPAGTSMTVTPALATQTSPPGEKTQTADLPPVASAPTETPVPALPRPRYVLTATLDYAAHHLQVNESIAYTNRSGEPLNNFVLMVEPMYYPGTFQLNTLTWAGGQAVENWRWDGARLSAPFPAPLAPGENIVIELDYELSLPLPQPSAETRPVPFGYTARQVNLVDWYPFIPPYQPGAGWIAHNAGFFGEHLAYENADFEVRFQLSDANPNIVVAASAPAETQAGWRVYRLENARNFVLSASDQYVVREENVDGIRVVGYHFPFHTQAGEAALQTTVESLRLYQQIYGPYGRDLLSVVEADFLDGMEYEGLYFLSNGFYNLYQGTPGEYLVAIAAHETAHQWFYAQLANDQALEPWLDEALCTYSERLFYENLYPEALDWWWTYRVYYYEPRGPVNGSIYNPEGYRAYRDAVYLNGAVFLEELRLLIGDESFYAFLKDYVTQYQRQIVRQNDFFTLLRAYSDQDLQPLLDKFFEGL